MVLSTGQRLEAGEYFLSVKTTSGTAKYDLLPQISPSAASVLDLSGPASIQFSLASLSAGIQYVLNIVPSANNQVIGIYDVSFRFLPSDVPQTVELGLADQAVRQDVLLGEEGNDILSGGSGEDWVFGGPGNDVATGGLDQQAGDLLFGEEGDDILQLLPDTLPRLPGTSQAIIPASSDQFDGGVGNDRVLFQGIYTSAGGGTISNLADVPDFVAVRYNRFLHRYEFTSNRSRRVLVPIDGGLDVGRRGKTKAKLRVAA
jgi:hypothetical protein